MDSSTIDYATTSELTEASKHETTTTERNIQSTTYKTTAKSTTDLTNSLASTAAAITTEG
jgi:hypothetical protein